MEGKRPLFFRKQHKKKITNHPQKLENTTKRGMVDSSTPSFPQSTDQDAEIDAQVHRFHKTP